MNREAGGAYRGLRGECAIGACLKLRRGLAALPNWGRRRGGRGYFAAEVHFWTAVAV